MMARLIAWIDENEAAAAGGLTAVGALAYLAQLVYRAFTQVSVLDEGGYLYVGYQFATGALRPFQDHGPWNNQMPLAFLIPGWVQRIFGPGLLSGRLYAVALAMLMLAGVRLAARRLGGRWAATAAVWALPVSVIASKQYSEAVTQPLAATLLVWMLVFALGPERKRWSVAVAGVLGGALVMTRLNLAPAVALVAVYLWWLHGKRGWREAAVFAAGAGVVVLGLHALYWPGILRIWAFWLPFGFLADFAPPAGYVESWVQVTGLWRSLSSIRLAVRANVLFIGLFVVGTALLVRRWQQGGGWDARQKAAALLAVSYTALALVHLYVSVLGDYCVFCLNSYLGFFNPLAALLLAAVWGDGRETGEGRWANGLVMGTLLAFGLAAFDAIGRTFVGARVIRWVVELPVPRVGGDGLLGGTIPLWGLLENAYGLDFRQASNAVGRALRLPVGLLVSVALGVLVMWAARRWGPRLARFGARTRVAQTLVLLSLTLGALAPTPWGANSYTQYDCWGNTIVGFERAGAQLAGWIPEGSEIFWAGGRSPVLMLYLPGRVFHLQQVNGAYTFKQGGEADALLRYGFYNETTALEWLYSADYVLVEEDVIDSWVGEQLAADPRFEVRYITGETTACYTTSQVLVYELVK